MSTFYVDHINGNDASAGTSWGTAVKVCANCGSEFARKSHEAIHRFNNRKYCCLKCRFPWNKGTVGLCKPNITSFQKGQESWLKGRRHSEETKLKVSLSKKGQRLGIPRTLEVRRKISEAQRGEKSHLWKGGATEEHKILRVSVEAKLWREAVFKRDNWTCQNCNIKGGTLHSHHVKPFSLYPDLRFDVNNGQTLCRDCHKLTDSYGKNNNQKIK